MDRMERLPCGSLIQHGTYNDRIYLMKVGASDEETLPEWLIALAREHRYTKIFAKVPISCAESFRRVGYAEEAAIPAFYNRSEEVCFMAFYLGRERALEAEAGKLDEIQEMACRKAGSSAKPLDGRFRLRRVGRQDVERMAEIYRAVFPSYPFPIHDPGYLLETMETHVDYFGVEVDGQLIALSSAEMDSASANVEMTDFATLPDWRGYGIAVHLLLKMEEAMRQKQIQTAYTIARAWSPGMNITFARLGYCFGGRLKNNTNISGRIESMNVWYRALQ